MSIAIAAAALGTAVAAGYALRPVVPKLEGERWLKVVLATLLRGEVEREGGDSDEWVRRVIRFAPYHPAGRLPEQKVSAPAGWAAPGLSVPGELGLLETLVRRATVQARWAFLYDEAEAGIEARIADPLELGDAYDPAKIAGVSWDCLADWGAGDDQRFATAVQGRLAARWVCVEQPSDLPPLLPAIAGLCDATRLPFDVALGPALEALVRQPEDRLVLVAEGDGVHEVLRALSERPGLRDHVLAVLSVAGRVQGTAELEDWNAAHFHPEGLDTEINRVTTYHHVTWFDRAQVPPGAPGLPIPHTRFPAVPRGDLSTLEVVDLGLLPLVPDLPVEQVARALWATVSLWALTRR